MKNGETKNGRDVWYHLHHLCLAYTTRTRDAAHGMGFGIHRKCFIANGGAINEMCACCETNYPANPHRDKERNEGKKKKINNKIVRCSRSPCDATALLW